MNPRYVTIGTANGVDISVDVSYLTPVPGPVTVTLNGPYTLAKPRPPGYPLEPGMTGVAYDDLEYPGRVLAAGTVLKLLQPEATALIEAGATTTFPGFSSITVPHGTNPTLTIDVAETLDTGSVPPASAFSVQDNGSAITISSTTVGASSITLALTGTISAGDAVTLTYTPPATNAAQNTGGTQMAPINSAAVTVN